MRLYIVRHGQNPANLTREFSYKKIDYPLTEIGREQAFYTAQAFHRRINNVFTSPLLRAKQTAFFLGLSTFQEPIEVEEFREINPGSFEGVPLTDDNLAFYDDMMARWGKGEHSVRCPGGESFDDLRERFERGLVLAVEQADGPRIVVVGHGATVLAALKALCPRENIPSLWALGVPNCSVTEFEFTPGKWKGRLVRFADNSHLPEAKPGW